MSGKSSFHEAKMISEKDRSIAEAFLLLESSFYIFENYGRGDNDAMKQQEEAFDLLSSAYEEEIDIFGSFLKDVKRNKVRISSKYAEDVAYEISENVRKS